MRLLVLMTLLAGCTQQDCVAPRSSGKLYQITGLTVPQQVRDFAYDLNGDGRADNQLGNIVGVMSGGGFDAQEYVDAAFQAGSDPMQIEVFQDENGTTAATFGETLPGRRAGLFCGSSVGLQFTSTSTAEMVEPVELDFTLSFADNVSVTLRGAHLKFTAEAIQGQLNGAISNDEIQSVVVAGIADLMTKKIQGDPGASSSALLRRYFDAGDGNTGSPCTNADGTISVRDDQLIGPCEVASSSLGKSVLAPDVDLFDDEGHFHPSKDNLKKDSLSVGVGFVGKAL